MDKSTRPERTARPDATGAPTTEPKVAALRRGAYTFLQQRAGIMWTHQGPDGELMGIATPPELVTRQPDYGKRMRQHARQEADRVAAAVPYQVSPGMTADAVLLGSQIREVGHAAAIAGAGKNTVDSIGITPPTPAGFLLWDDPAGVGYHVTGAPLVAVHWGPLGRRPGTWLAWWCETTGWLAHYRDACAADKGGMTWSNFTATFLANTGSLFCVEQNILSPLGANPELAQPPADPESVEWEPGELESVALLHTTLATWALLGTPGATEQRSVPVDAAADRRARVRPVPAVVASLPGEGRHRMAG